MVNLEPLHTDRPPGWANPRTGASSAAERPRSGSPGRRGGLRLADMTAGRVVRSDRGPAWPRMRGQAAASPPDRSVEVELGSIRVLIDPWPACECGLGPVGQPKPGPDADQLEIPGDRE